MNVLEFFKNKKTNSIEQMSLMLLEEKQFLRLASDETKGMAYSSHRNLDYELYYRHKTTIYQCDICVKALNHHGSTDQLITSMQNKVLKEARYPYCSTNQVLNHEHLIENSVRQELVDELKNLILDNSSQKQKQ